MQGSGGGGGDGWDKNRIIRNVGLNLLFLLGYCILEGGGGGFFGGGGGGGGGQRPSSPRYTHCTVTQTANVNICHRIASRNSMMAVGKARV